jgi:hypothetical protein
MIINTPFSGKLNLDDAEYRVSNNDYIDALNITKDAQGTGQDKVVSNIQGNTLIPYTAPAGTNKVIGFYADKVRNRAYYFLWNSGGFNSIIYYDLNNQSITTVLKSKTDSSNIDILNFNPSYKVLSINIFYRDIEGDILFFNDGYNPPKSLNVRNIYGSNWKLEYLLVAKAPPIMPPQVVYENDTTITINNLRNKLFQFCYRYVYDNNEKSVWSSKSIVPLPQQPPISLTDNIATNNARIAVNFSTGAADVKAIEISFRETTNGLTSDWYLIKYFDKDILIILDNDVYNFKFYNDEIYTQIDVIESSQLQDWVPQRANAGELANGNVLLYAGILEGYDKTKMSLGVSQTTGETAFYYEQAGLLFFATVNGNDSGRGTVMNIYLYGTGTNGLDGNVTTLNNAAGGYYINSFSSNLATNLSVSYSTSGATSTYSVSSILNGISAAMVVKGYTQVGAIVGNKLTMSLASGFVLTSTAFKTFPVLDSDNTRFANVWDSGYQYAIQYFDAQGRTIGAQTSLGGTINTPQRDLTNVGFPQIYLTIFNQPPLYAYYYQVLRSNNTTYNKRLCWVSESAYAGITNVIDNSRYLYIGIANVIAYNESISSTQNVVSYNYSDGDRIRFIRRYDVDNNPVVLPKQYDYEIIGTQASIEHNIIWDTLPIDKNTYNATGNFLKIRYPNDDIGVDFQFPGNADWQHFEILLYNYTNNSLADQRFFYEFGKQYGIGNPATDTRFHYGLAKLSNGGTVVSVTNGDLFYRIRQVPYSDNYNFISNYFEMVFYGLSLPFALTFPIPLPRTISNNSYLIQTEIQFSANVLPNTSNPTWATAGYLFWNKSNKEKIISVSGTLQVATSENSQFSVYALICQNVLPPLNFKYSISLLPTEINNLTKDINSQYKIDQRFAVPANARVWIAASALYAPNGICTIYVQPFNFNFNIVKDKQIEIIESSFSDNYNLITNSNGRPSVIDANAAQTYFPTVIRFGQAYQSNTNINATNRFYYEDFDEYDRTFGDVLRLHVRDRYLKVYQQFKVGNVPILTQIVKDVTGNPLQANSNQLINKIQYYAGDYGIGDASTSLAWNNFADYFVDNFRGVVCRLSQDGITPISIINKMNAFFVAKTAAYRKDLNNRYNPDSIYTGDPCIYGVFDANTNKYIIALEEVTRYNNCNYNGGTAYIIPPTTTTTTTTAAPTTSTTTVGPSTTTTTSAPALRVDPSYTVLCAGGGSTIVAIVYTAGTNICNSTSISATSFNPYPAGRYYLYISTLGWVEYNKPGGIGTSLMNKVGAGCTACPAQTTTTTNPGYYYNVTRYACDNNCTLLNSGLLGFSSTPLINNYYYNNGDGLGVYYVVSGTSIGTINVNLNLSYGNATCNLACAI